MKQIRLIFIIAMLMTPGFDSMAADQDPGEREGIPERVAAERREAEEAAPEKPKAPGPGEAASEKPRANDVPEPGEPTETPGPAEPFAFDEMVVTAARRETRAFDSPLPMNVVTEEQIRQKGSMSMADLLIGEPGVDVSTTGTGSVRPMIRGLFDERVLILVDGIRLSEQRPGGNHVFSLDPAQIERIEIVRGPASVLYGSDAIGGVMNVITKKGARETAPGPRLHAEQDVQIESATDGWKESTHVRFGAGRFNGYVGGFYKDTEDIETPRGKLPQSFYKGATLWGGGNYTGEDWSIRAGYSFVEADIGIPAPRVFLKDFFKDERHHMVTARLERKDISPTFKEFTLDAGFQRHMRHRFRLRESPDPAVTENLQVDIGLDINTVILQPQVILELGDAQTVTAGMGFFHEGVTSDRRIVDTGSSWVDPDFHEVPVIPDSTRWGLGHYIQDEIRITERLTVTPGLRYDWIETHTDGHPRHQQNRSTGAHDEAVSGNLGVLYKLTENVNLFANAGRAFRGPTLLERYFDGPHDAGKNDVGNPGLDPETSWNFDAGVKVRLGRVRGMASAFYNRIDDYIVKQDVGTAYQWLNLSDVSLYGAESGVDVRIGHGISAFGNLAYVRGTDEKTDEPLPSIPPLKGRYGLRFERDLGRSMHLWSEAAARASAKQPRAGPNEKRTSGWTCFDLRAGLDFGEHWRLVFAAENVLDRVYHDHLSRAWQDFDLNDQAGLNIRLGLVVRF